ncbi:MAG: hypothetical protein H0V79_06645 [Actinobacteria bacterium]|nr:hypothetical protein [Actinomycetota bacterium]
MLFTQLPFDNLQYMDRGDRVRRSRTRPNARRVRRGGSGGANRREVTA